VNGPGSHYERLGIVTRKARVNYGLKGILEGARAEEKVGEAAEKTSKPK